MFKQIFFYIYKIEENKANKQSREIKSKKISAGCITVIDIKQSL